MEPKSELEKLKERALALPAGTRIAAIVGALLVAAGGIVAVALSSDGGGAFQVAFARLTPEDSAASADALRAAGIPFRVEVDGAAISVPSNKVHDARLMLASRGLPRASGVGFELFDKTDLGVSEFTQRVNLQRAIEGELTRTIVSMAKVRDARVHLTMPKRGLLRGDDKGAAAAVMLRLEPGRSLDTKEIAGVRHLIAAAVPELDVERVTVVDESGTLLGANATGDGARTELERELESRVVAVVEPAIGKGSVVARVTAEMDQAQEDRTESVYDPNKSVLASERTHLATTNASTPGAGDVGGAVANDPMSSASAPVSNANVKSTNVDDKTRTYSVSGTVTHRVTREPRVRRLSVAVLVNAAEAKDDDQIKKLTELAKRAVGFDEERGDMLELTSVAFRAEPVSELAPSPDATPARLPGGIPVGAAVVAAGVVALAAVALAFLFGRRRRESGLQGSASKALEARSGPNELSAPTVIGSSANVKSESEATIAEVARDKARLLAGSNPERAALILEAWLRDADASEEPSAAGGSANASSAKETRHG